MSDSLSDKGKILENMFFRTRDQELLAKLRAEMAANDVKASMAAASGISDETVLTSLIENDVTPESLTSVALIPLVAVAWADKELHGTEREAILRAAATTGIVSGSASYELIESWMEQNPGSELLDAWKDYIAALKTDLNEAAFFQLKTTVMERAKNVAQAAGGFLGVATTSNSENQVIADLESAFN